MTELYNTEILRWTTRIPHTKRLLDPEHTIVKTSRICGSRLTIDVELEGGAITRFGQEVRACALGQATAAIFGQNVIGLTADEFADIKSCFETMVETGVPDFPEKWADLARLAPIKDHPGRKGSVMLPFECLAVVFAK